MVLARVALSAWRGLTKEVRQAFDDSQRLKNHLSCSTEGIERLPSSSIGGIADKKEGET
jgi:hypothetical protein